MVPRALVIVFNILLISIPVNLGVIILGYAVQRSTLLPMSTSMLVSVGSVMATSVAYLVMVFTSEAFRPTLRNTFDKELGWQEQKSRTRKARVKDDESGSGKKMEKDAQTVA